MFCRAESQGVVSATVFLFVMFCFIFVPFQEHLIKRGTVEFPFNKVHILHYIQAVVCDFPKSVAEIPKYLRIQYSRLSQIHYFIQIICGFCTHIVYHASTILHVNVLKYVTVMLVCQ